MSAAFASQLQAFLHSSLHHGNEIAVTGLVVLGTMYLLFGLDDAFIDAVAAIRRIRPRRLSSRDLRTMHCLPEKPIAIFIPAWREGNIIRRMLEGNLARLDYNRFHIFVGVYPNDPVTVDEVRRVAAKYRNVHTVVSSKDGPTSKAQVLNEVFANALAFERTSGITFQAFHMQDAEDIFHPRVLRLVNAELDRADFVQVPVFSLEVRSRALVAGTYVDEFAESHTKDILVREWMGAAVPSAGVGTTLSRQLALEMREEHGTLYHEGSLTEDYELGIRAHALGFRPRVACCYTVDPATGDRDFIATREYFPKHFSRSVRQKTRWTVGIALQGWRNLGWQGALSNRYFLLRDRKGLWSNLATFLGYPLLAYTSLYAAFVDGSRLQHTFSHPLMHAALALNIMFMTLRLVQRARCVSMVYGWRAAVLIPCRWPLANMINALAALHAIKNDSMARAKKARLAWEKTEHELPQYFGTEAVSLKGSRF